MQLRVVFLKPKFNSGVKKTLPRFYVDLLDEVFDPSFDFCLIEGEYPIYLIKNKVAHDTRPTLSHFLIDGEFPTMLGFGYISSKRTKAYDMVMKELYHESIHRLKKDKKSGFLSALRWPTGVASLEFIDFYYEEMIFFSSHDRSTVTRYLKLLVKASGMYYATIEDQIVEVHRRTLLEGQKYGLTKYDLPGNDIIADICVVQAARVTKKVSKLYLTKRDDFRLLIYYSISPFEPAIKRLLKVLRDVDSCYFTMTCEEIYDKFMREDVSFRECALSTSWGRDWPTPIEASKMSRKEKKKEMKLAKWLPRSPDYPPL
ncbi:viral sRNA Nonstructural protein [Zerdali virus]|uniref:Viral sRNA Nonstructural protein n=1 Tax=Zerdali virus TaxID=1764086 RepID=A0A159D840_9VIRU|nr:viral sRNA Nonstructural protein [Zerdali virus]ALS88190.1 viral sRNA Nonstructural protein [Zerdali virus]